MDDLAKQRVEERDLFHLDPSERAELVNSLIFHALDLSEPKAIIENPLYWDLLCWAVEIVSLYAQQLALAGSPDLLISAKATSKLFYSLHYSIPDGSPELGPLREDHHAEWIKRIEEHVQDRQKRSQ